MNQVRKADPNSKVAAENRKARFNYEVLDTLETGLVLSGTEVKALRGGHANIQESYASFEGGEIWLINSYLPEYLQANRFNHEPRRRRKLLVSKREMARLSQSIEREGMTLVPQEDLLQRPGQGEASARDRARQEAA
jgi:SsrA-binding protein